MLANRIWQRSVMSNSNQMGSGTSRKGGRMRLNPSMWKGRTGGPRTYRPTGRGRSGYRGRGKKGGSVLLAGVAAKAATALAAKVAAGAAAAKTAAIAAASAAAIAAAKRKADKLLGISTPTPAPPPPSPPQRRRKKHRSRSSRSSRSSRGSKSSRSSLSKKRRRHSSSVFLDS